MSIRFGDIRDQSRKLSEIAPDFGRFIGPPLGAGLPKIVPTSLPLARGTSSGTVWIELCEDTPTRSKVIDVYTLNFKLNFKFSPLNFCGGTSVPVGVCAR